MAKRRSRKSSKQSRNPVLMELFGKDHWSTFAYIETRIVDYKGVPDRHHLRVDPKRHPGLAHVAWNKDYPTRIRGGIKLPQHDDIDCIDDAVAAGLLKWEGSGINPWFKLTELGEKIAAQLRQHKQQGEMFASFIPKFIAA